MGAPCPYFYVLKNVPFCVPLSVFWAIKVTLSMVDLVLIIYGLIVLFSCRYGIAHPFHAVKQDANEVNSW